MLVSLLQVPRNQSDWDVWSFAHRDQHAIVLAAIMAQKHVNLVGYPLYPIPFQDLTQWLSWNQQSHDDINAVLGTQSSNLEQSDFTNSSQLESWIYLHYQEHQNWSNSLAVS